LHFGFASDIFSEPGKSSKGMIARGEEESMGKMLGYISLLIVLAVGIYIYAKQSQSVTPAGAGSPQAAIDITRVKTDLLSLAQAENRYYAQQGKYASIDELRSSGELSAARDKRGPYTYTTEITASGFRIVATYSGPPEAKLPETISIDETMHLTQ